ncbi:MAG: ABC transporter permease, partial [Desulfovibrio sp.]
MSRRSFLIRHLASRYSLLVVGGAIVAIMSLLALLAPLIAPFDPTAIDVNAIFLPPGSGHLLGTDALGRDVFSRMLFGARASLWVGFTAVAIAATLGTFIGLVAGYVGGLVDELLMRLVDVMLCFPSFFLILAVVAFLEPSLFNIMVVIGLTSWMGVARLVRAETLKLREQDFVAAARLSGAGPLRILFLHILPNAMAPVLVSATLGVAGAILTESALSFLGLGVQPPDPSWGNILMDGKSTLTIAPWLSIFPGLAILLT